MSSTKISTTGDNSTEQKFKLFYQSFNHGIVYSATATLNEEIEDRKLSLQNYLEAACGLIGDMQNMSHEPMYETMQLLHKSFAMYLDSRANDGLICRADVGDLYNKISLITTLVSSVISNKDFIFDLLSQYQELSFFLNKDIGFPHKDFVTLPENS